MTSSSLSVVAENPVSTTTLKQTVEKNWNDRKVQVISSGAATGLLAAGVGIATVLGGPLAAIISLAAATFVALGTLVTSLVVSKKQVTVQQPQPQISKPVVASAAAAAAPVTKAAAPVAASTPVETPVAEKPTLGPRIKNAFSAVGNYVTAHPYKTALGIAAVATAGYAAHAIKSASPASPTSWRDAVRQHAARNPVCKNGPIFGPPNHPWKNVNDAITACYTTVTKYYTTVNDGLKVVGSKAKESLSAAYTAATLENAANATKASASVILDTVTSQPAAAVGASVLTFLLYRIMSRGATGAAPAAAGAQVAAIVNQRRGSF